MSTIPQLNDLKRRKYDLATKAARYGINTPPEVAIEKSDLETVIGLMERIDIHRRNIQHLVNQRDQLGSHVPPHVLTQIANERSQVALLRNQCARLRYPVDAHSLDDDEPTDTPMPDPVLPSPAQPDRLARIEAKIDRILQLLEER